MSDEALVLESAGTLFEAASRRDLATRAGVYAIFCHACSHCLYIGKADGLLGRLFQHAFIAPYGAADIVIGESVKPEATSRLCEHLRRLRGSDRVRVVQSLDVKIMVVENSKMTPQTESKLAALYPGAFGQYQRIWRKEYDLRDYMVHRHAGYLPREPGNQSELSR